MDQIPNRAIIRVGKGGVAKTALATTLSALWVSEHGLRILLVDADAQANATLAMGLSPVGHGDGRVLTDAVTYGDPLRVVSVKETRRHGRRRQRNHPPRPNPGDRPQRHQPVRSGVRTARRPL